jgi:hypothetical protein
MSDISKDYSESRHHGPSTTNPAENVREPARRDRAAGGRAPDSVPAAPVDSPIRRAASGTGAAAGEGAPQSSGGEDSPGLPGSADIEPSSPIPWSEDEIRALAAGAAVTSSGQSGAPGAVLKALMERYVQLKRKSGAKKGWQLWAEDAALASHVICPDIIPYDNLMKLIMEVDTTILKGNSEQVGRTAEQALREFLSSNTIGGELLDNSVESMPQAS